MRFSFKVWAQQVDWTDLRDTWIAADREGFWDAVWVNDHLYPPKSPSDLSYMEAWTLLSALAAVTSRVRFGAMVSSNTFRHPALLAKMAATVDRISDGRLEIGIGAGWHEAEHAAFGIDLPPFAERFERLEEACAVIDGLLTKEVFTFHGTYYRITEARCEPKAVQKPRPPILIGGEGMRRTLPLVVRWADHWNFPDFDADLEAFRVRVVRLRELCAEVGRDPAEIEVSAQMRYPKDLVAVVDRAEGYQEAGADHVLVSFSPGSDLSLPTRVAEVLAARFR